MLNACRHQRSVHTACSRDDQQPQESAQRLSASKIGSQQIDTSTRPQVGCSTPVGVKDRFTLDQLQGALSAERAQRLSASKIGSPWMGLGGSRPCRSAQRLSASKIGSPTAQLAPPIFGSCAQRLSASKIGSPLERHSLPTPGRVLNACRHQRSVHAIAKTLLNAYRSAQRLSASKIGSLEHNIEVYAFPVLNACRHQRSVHPCRRRARRSMQCSTPVGIKDRFTHRQQQCRQRVLCSTPVGVKDRFTM